MGAPTPVFEIGEFTVSTGHDFEVDRYAAVYRKGYPAAVRLLYGPLHVWRATRMARQLHHRQQKALP